MPRQVYVRGHYRRLPAKRSISGLGCLLLCAGLVALYALFTAHPTLLLWLLGGCALVLGCFIAYKIDRRRTQRWTQMLAETQRQGRDSRYIPTPVRQEVWSRCKGQCVQCGSTFYLEFDHIIPLSKGGATSVNNLQLLCRGCNSRKAASI